MAGIPDEELSFVRRTPQQYLEKLIKVSNELGYVPSQNEFCKMGFTPSILIREFGSYSEAVKHANLSNRQCKFPIIDKNNDKYSKGQM